jgi:hypothetical protein
MSSARDGLGALLTTDVEYVALGTFGDRALRARVEHRRLRLRVGPIAGRAVGGSLTLGRLRPVAVEVDAPGARYEVVIPAVEDPRVRAARRALLLWGASLLAAWWLDRRRARRATLGTA